MSSRRLVPSLQAWWVLGLAIASVFGCRPAAVEVDTSGGTQVTTEPAATIPEPTPVEQVPAVPVAAPLMRCGDGPLPELADAPELVAAPTEPEPAPSITPSKSSASGFPQHDPLREVTHWGRVRPTDSPISTPAHQTGHWQQDADRLAPAPASEKAEQAWFPRSPAAHLGEGLIRARIELRGTVDVAVLFRQDYRGDEPRVLSGYGAAIEQTNLRLYRWDRGMQLPMGSVVKLGKLDKRKSLEIVVFMIGPQLLANVYDGDTLEHLGTAAIHDTTYAYGCVGLWTGERHDPKSAFTLLTSMDAAANPGLGTAGPTAHLRDPAGPRYGVLPPSDTTPFGNTRYAWIRAEDLDALPKALRATLEAKVEHEDGERALLFLDTVGYERLLRTGVEVLAIDSNAPWSAFDPAFRKRASELPSKRGRGFVLDDSYKDPALVEQLLRAYHERYPTFTRLIEIGRSHQGRPIWALKISDPDADPNEPAVLFNAAHHGSELLSIEYVLDAIDTLVGGYGHDPQVTRWIDGLEIWCVPLVNPDGNHMFIHESRFTTRKNGRDGNADGVADPFEGVDLNRNYPFGWGSEPGSSGMPMHKWYRGERPGSEPETQAMMTLADAEHFASVISFHTFGTDIYSPYGAPGKRNPKPDVNGTIGRALAELTPAQPNGRTYGVRHGGYPVAGSDQDWHLFAHGSVAFVVEGSHHNPPLDVRTEAVDATRPFWRELLERTLTGPWIGGHLRDGNGNPVPARLMIREIETFEGERWTTRPRDGRFDRAVLEPGTYTLEIEPEGGVAFTREVEVGSGRVELDLVVP